MMEEENATERGTDNIKNKVLESSDGSSCARGQDKTEKQKVAAAAAAEVPYYKLLSFADTMDHALMIIGSITAVGSGISFSMMAVLFGEIVDSFGMTLDNDKVVGEVSKVQCIFNRMLFWLCFLDDLSTVCHSPNSRNVWSFCPLGYDTSFTCPLSHITLQFSFHFRCVIYLRCYSVPFLQKLANPLLDPSSLGIINPLKNIVS